MKGIRSLEHIKWFSFASFLFSKRKEAVFDKRGGKLRGKRGKSYEYPLFEVGVFQVFNQRAQPAPT